MVPTSRQLSAVDSVAAHFSAPSVVDQDQWRSTTTAMTLSNLRAHTPIAARVSIFGNLRRRRGIISRRVAPFLSRRISREPLTLPCSRRTQPGLFALAGPNILLTAKLIRTIKYSP
jgi:hypothetical protein